MAMPLIRVRDADPEKDREKVLAVLAESIPAAAGRERYDWLYLSNPQGRSLVWIAEDAETGETVGTSAAHPRLMGLGGRQVVALNFSDFAVLPRLRALGPALALLKATMAPVLEGRYAFSYDHPSASMEALYRRMRVSGAGYMGRWVLILDPDAAITRRWGEGATSRLAGIAARAALRLRDALRSRPAGIVVDAFESEFDAEFERLGRPEPVRGVRSAPYLNWHVRRNAVHRHFVLAARRSGNLAGYSVLRETGAKTTLIVEVEAADDADAYRALLIETVARARGRGHVAVEGQALTGSPTARLLSRLGFRPRETNTALVPVAPKGAPYAPLLASAQNWWMIEGDRDV